MFPNYPCESMTDHAPRWLKSVARFSRVCDSRPVSCTAFVTAMDFDSATPITFRDADLPCCHRGFVRSIDSRIFWTLHNMHFELSKLGVNVKLNKFVHSIVRIVDAVDFVGNADVLPKPKATSRGGVVPFNLASTLAIMTAISANIALNQVKPQVKNVY